MYEQPMNPFKKMLWFVALVVAIIWFLTIKLPDDTRIVVVQPTYPVQPTYVVEVVQPVVQSTPTSTIAPTYDATAADFFAWQTAQADTPTPMAGRIGQGSPTPEGSAGSRDMSNDTHQRTQ